MAQSQFSLSWNAHKENICHGFSSLQQNGEFVDMTLAADGHLVKVHQVIIALASSYMKDLISTTQCRHPVIFLNKISYTTLCAILEYVYTGETLVAIENLNEFLEAGKELHIKGLEDMKIHDTFTRTETTIETPENDIDTEGNMGTLNDDICYFEVTAKEDDEPKYIVSSIGQGDDRLSNTENVYPDGNDDDSMTGGIALVTGEKNMDKSYSTMQYTVSNQGSLQMILNRYVYYLKHTNRDNCRQWRCVDYLNNTKCPAHVFTKNDLVVQRVSAHIHPFHDKRILKKVRAGAIFTAINEAMEEGKSKKCQSTVDE